VSDKRKSLSFPVAVLSKVWVCVRLLTGILFRIYSGIWMSVYFECFIRKYLKDLMPNWEACSVKDMLTNFT